MKAVSRAPDPDDRQMRLTEREALTNLRTVLELCAAGEVRCSDKTSRPSAATIRTIAAHLAHGDFYPDESIAAFAWPLLVQAVDWPNSIVPASSQPRKAAPHWGNHRPRASGCCGSAGSPTR